MAGTVLSPEYLAESKAILLAIFYSIPMPLEVLSTSLRLWVKLSSQPDGRFCPDDVIISIATIVAVGVCIAGLAYGAPYGLGRHIEAVSAEDMAMFLKGDYIFSHFYNAAIATTKLAILALYHRIFATPGFRRLIIFTAAVVMIWLLGMEITLGFGCRPIQAWWGVLPGKCVDKVKFTYGTNIINIVLDMWIFCMPIPIIFGLRTGQHKKVSLVFLFSVGLATCAISAARLKYVFSTGTRDFTWEMTGLGILSAWEPCGGILCANLPVVYRYLVQAAANLRVSIVGSSHGGEAKTHKPAPRSGERHVQREWVQLPPDRAGMDTVAMDDYYSKACRPLASNGEMEMGRLPRDGIKISQYNERERPESRTLHSEPDTSHLEGPKFGKFS